ncbi:P-loop containing nucleoside triphosphate hydrolase protein [Trametes maxima]|nr:P-loop containing nucleoside triphosphate hydrolase protein [Trametes maxima]
MSEDDYFDDELDSAFLNEVEAIEAAHVPLTNAAAGPSAKPNSQATSTFKPASASRLPAPPKPVASIKPASKVAPPPKPCLRQASAPNVIEIDDSSDYGDAFDDVVLDDAALAQIDHICEQESNSSSRGKGHMPAQPVVRPSGTNGLVRRPSKGVQLTLFGDVAKDADPAPSSNLAPKQAFQRTRSRQKPLPGQAKKTKQWDRTAYAKTGWRKPKDKGKGRGLDDEHEEEHIEFEQFPAPELPAPPMRLSADRLAAKTWIYPLNKPKRDYQYNIVKKCLFENTLVALPTGLGKTFIAGVVMLNYYNWFPQGKVVFVAPTKPLVAQQIDACHKTCGIPGSVAAELTGNVTKDRRINSWRTQRVFYATPQTLLNDLVQGLVDALDIVLIVIDEAHRGTGDYAYAQVVRFMMQHNPHFRIMALTATPGGKPEAVQEIVDALHISHIEIRNEDDADLKKYLHKKHEQEHFIHMTQDIATLRDGLASLMTPILKKVQSAGFLTNGNTAPTMLHPFRAQSTVIEMSKSKAPQYAIGAAAQLGPLARAMGYLMENSVTMCYGFLKGIASGQDDSSAKKAIRKIGGFTDLMKLFEEQATRGFAIHPKMDTLRTLLIDHFAKQLPDELGGPAEGAPGGQSRAMVFVSFRECVEEIVELLNKESPIIRAKAFIGQGTDKQGKKGYAQKEQLEVIEQFKAGTFNVLVSTSIGEEGLDIGEVDLIVCYDAQKTPIRMLQRIGRTGRKQAGTVHILLAKGREEHNWQKAQSNYQDVQHFIVRASDLEVYGDVDRLLPDDIEPQPVEMEMEIEAYVREERTSRKGSFATNDSSNSKSKKRARDDDPSRNIPAGASKGFVNARSLVKISGAARRKKEKPVDLAHAGEDDSDDEDIEAGVFAAPRRAASTSAVPRPSKGKTKLPRSATTSGPTSKKKAVGTRKKGPKVTVQTTLTRTDLVPSDDNEDEDIERGFSVSKKPQLGGCPVLPKEYSRTPPRAHAGGNKSRRSSSPDTILDNSVINITTPDVPIRRTDATMLFSSPERPLKSINKSLSRSSSPDYPLRSVSRSTSVFSRGQRRSQSSGRSSKPPERSTSPSSQSVNEKQPKEANAFANAAGDDSMAWLIEDDDEPDLALINSSPGHARKGAESLAMLDDEPLFLDTSPPHKSSPPPAFLSSDEPEFVDEPVPPPKQYPQASSSRYQEKPRAPHRSAMGPPALPAHIAPNSSPLLPDEAPPPLTFAVRAPGKQARKRPAAEALDVDIESSPLVMPPPSQRRLQRERPRSPSPAPAAPPRKKKRKFKDAAEAARRNPWIDLEAAHSGDELSLGSSEPDHAPDSDDRMFVDEPAETQMSPSYDQSAVYRQSLLTQAPGRGGPVFAHGPVRRGRAAFGPNRAGPSRYQRGVTSSPVGGDEEPDEYVFGSFVVEDDAEISFTGTPSSEP